MIRCSVVIPAYNAARTIEGCLKSVFDQTLSSEEYEVIVVDDGSTDRTAEIAGSFPVTLMRQPNSGPAVARNAGARQAKGEVLVFTDSDCEMDREFLSGIVESCTRGDVAGVQGAYRTRQKEFMARYGQVEIETRYTHLLRQEYIDFIGTYAAAYRRDVFLANGGFDTSFPSASGEDTEFSYKLQKQGFRLVFNPGAFVYHLHPTSLKAYLRVKFYRGFWRVRLYSIHPEKTLHDSYTPASLKTQVVTTPLFPLFLGLGVIQPWFLLLFCLLAGMYIAWSLPFLRKFRSYGYRGAWKVPGVIVLRAFALASGLVAGLFGRVYAGRDE